MLVYLDRLALIVTALVFSSSLMHSQNGAEEAKFEVASIKPSAPNLGHAVRTRIVGGPGTADPGRFSTENFSLFYLLSSAYDLKRYQIAAPQWTESALFDVSANVPKGASKAQFRLMLQDMLVERFKLGIHWERRDVDAYQLVLKAGARRLKRAEEATGTERLSEMRDTGPAVVRVNGNYRLRVTHETMKQLAARLSQELKAPVEDATGLDGSYDLTMTWSRDETRGESQTMRLQTQKEIDGDVAPGIFTALQEQLGLKLVFKKTAVDVLVVDRINKLPTDN